MWLVPMLWAGAFLTGSAALKQLSPGMVSFLRFAVTVAGGSVVLGRPGLAVLRACPKPRAWAALLTLAIFGGLLYHVVFYAGLAATQPPVASVVIATNPILTTLGAAIFLRTRRPTLGLFVGLAFAFSGVVLLAADKPMAGDAEAGFLARIVAGWGRGETLCLVASASWAIFAVLLQHFRTTALAGLPSAGVTYIVYVLTTILLLPCLFFPGAASSLAAMTLPGWGCMLYLGVGSTVIAYTLYNAALDRVGSARVSQITYAVPALTTLLSLWLVPDFHPGWRTWCGLGLVTIGLVVSEGRLLAKARERFRFGD